MAPRTVAGDAMARGKSSRAPHEREKAGRAEQPQRRAQPAKTRDEARKPGKERTVAQMRLQPGDADVLRRVQEVFGLETTADVLREALRRMAIEADEILAAENIRAYYAGQTAPLPEGVAALTQEEAAEADAEIERGIAEGRW